jgi:1-acyl-sn-glycerol-3-phosphate acyltransferase
MKHFFILLYQIFIWLPVFLSVTILTALTVTIGCFLGGERFFSYYPGMWWSKIICFVTLCPVTVRGRENLNKNQSYIFVANHQGIYDIFLIYGYLNVPIKWMMKQSLRKIPFVGKACEMAGFIFVDNSSPKAVARTIRETEQKLRNGASVALFPEGSRTQTGRLGKFKKGAYQMAVDLRLPIVPVTINGSYHVMPKGFYFIRPHKMELLIHEPVSTEDLTSDNIRDIALNISNLIEKTKAKIECDLWDEYK